MDKDTNFDVPVFKSLPQKIEENKVTFEKLQPISIVDMYQKEPYINYESYIDYFKYLYLIIFIFLIFYIISIFS